MFRFADQESLERWFNSPERRDCLARLDPLTDGIPSYEPVYGEQALWTQVRVPRANPHKQTLISWLATVVFAFTIRGIVSAMGAGSLVGLLVTTAARCGHQELLGHAIFGKKAVTLAQSVT